MSFPLLLEEYPLLETTGSQLKAKTFHLSFHLSPTDAASPISQRRNPREGGKILLWLRPRSIVAKKWDPGILDPGPFSAQIRKVEARLGKLAKIRKVETD